MEGNPITHLAAIDYAIMAVYFVAVLGVGLGAQARHANEHRLLPRREDASGLGDRARVHLGEPRRAGSDRHGRVGGQVRHRHEPLLLGGCDSGDGVRRAVHDALLLRIAGALGARVPQAPVRRKDAHAQRGDVRGDDDLLIGDLDVRDGEALSSPARLELRHQRARLGGDRARLRHARRADERDLQRGASVLPDRVRLRATRVPRASFGGWMGRADGQAERRRRRRTDSRPARTRTRGED